MSLGLTKVRVDINKKQKRVRGEEPKERRSKITKSKKGPTITTYHTNMTMPKLNINAKLWMLVWTIASL
jgi:hypothetical protein